MDLPGSWAKHGSVFHQRITEGMVAALPISNTALGSKKPPGGLRSIPIFAHRAVLQILHNPYMTLTDSALELCTGLILGYLYSLGSIGGYFNTLLMYSLGINLTIGLASLKTFGAERVVHWRENAKGAGMNLSCLAYFLGKVIVDLPRIAVLAAMITLSFVPLVRARAEAAAFYACSLAAAFAMSGYAYILSIAFDPKAAQLYCVVLVLVSVLFAGVSPLLEDMGTVEYALSWTSPGRWLCEDLFIANSIQLSAAFRLPPHVYASP